MNKRKHFSIVGILLVFTINGCANLAADLVETGKVTVRTLSSPEASFEDTQVRQKNTTVTISGSLRHHEGANRQPVSGHIDAYITDETGTLLFAANIPYRRIHPRSTYVTFEFSFDLSPDRVFFAGIAHDPTPLDTHVELPEDIVLPG